MTGIASDFYAELEDDGIILLDDPEPAIRLDQPKKIGRPRKYHADRPATAQERDTARNHRESAERQQERLRHLAVLDFETDPFDAASGDPIAPFTGCLWSENFEPVIIWEENEEKFVDAIIAAIEALPGAYTIYAHNGGKFDFLFLIHRLRGKVMFKGRGIMSAKIGPHELRDSFHIIPEKLASYHKEEFDYGWLVKSKRKAHKQAIIDYMVSDCVYLYEIVKGFLERFGMKISIGQAAIAEMRKHYKVGHIGAKVDETLREYFFGGRVECLAGRGHFVGAYKLYDRNSMYPASMAFLDHPIGSHYIRRERKSSTGAPAIGPNTFFIELTCRNYGALVTRRENPESGEWETTTAQEYGTFKTTIWEYNMALELGLIEAVKIHAVIDCTEKSNFSKFILPLYAEKEAAKLRLDLLTKQGLDNTAEYWAAKKDYTFSKLIQNNGYGKLAQNPRNYKEHELTDPDAKAPAGYDQILPTFRNDFFAIWERPANKKGGFLNVGTAASITGASRADLMRVIHNAVDPIYCDTDSVICRSVSGIEIHPTKLGAWDLEKEMDEVIIAGKKLYGYKQYTDAVGQNSKIKVKSKGVSDVTWDELLRLLDDEIISKTNKGATITKTGRQFYMTRKIRATAPLAKRKRSNGNHRTQAPRDPGVQHNRAAK